MKKLIKNRIGKRNLSGQILVIVVIVLLLLSIIIISFVAVVTRDTEQSLSAEEYETSYNLSEEKLQRLLEDYSDVEKDLSGLLGVEGCYISGSESEYKCSYNYDNLHTDVTVLDTNKIDNYEIGKDETLTLTLNNYLGPLVISWTNDSAIELTLDYINSDFEYKNIKDVYNQGEIFSQAGAGDADHPMNYVIDPNNEKSIQVNTTSITGISSADSLQSLKIKLMMKDDNASSLISVSGENTLPKQIREFKAVTYYKSTGADSSAPILITQIPLAGRLPELFNYVYKSNTQVTK